MVRCLRPISCAVLLTFPAIHCQTSSSTTSPASQSSLQDEERVRHWSQDLDYLVKELPSRHPNLFTKISKKGFEGEAERLRHDLPTLTDAGIIVEMMKLVASVGDSHTSLLPPRSNGFHVLPLALRWFDDGVFVVAAGPTQRQMVGQRVIAIGDVPWDEAAKRLAMVRAAETPGWSRNVICSAASAAEILNGVGLAKTCAAATFTLQDETGKLSKFELQGVNSDQDIEFTTGSLKVPDYVRPKHGLQNWFVLIPEKSLMHVHYNACQDEPHQSVQDFCSKVIASLNASKVQNVLIDLRGNSGGDSSLINPLLHHFRSPGFSKRLFVATNGSTFSSGMMNALDFKRAGGEIIGEPAGTPLDSFGEVKNFSLPNSGVRVFHSTKRFTLEKKNKDENYLAVDIPVCERSKDWFIGQDAILDHFAANP